AGATVSTDNATVTFHGAVSNAGTMHLTHSTQFFNGGIVNSGTIITDPNVFNTTDLINTDPAAIVAAAGDRFRVSNDVGGGTKNQTGWSTNQAILEFVAGTDSQHNMELQGIDLGASILGLTDNFAWGTLELDASQTLA